MDSSALFAGLGPGAPFPQRGQAIGTLRVDGFYRANWKLVEEGMSQRSPSIGSPRWRQIPGTVEAITTEGSGLLAFMSPDAETHRVEFVPAAS